MEYRYKNRAIRVEGKNLGNSWNPMIWIDGEFRLLAESFGSETMAIARGREYAEGQIDAPASMALRTMKLFDSGKQHHRGDPKCPACDEGFPQVHQDQVTRAYGQFCVGLMHCETGPFGGVAATVADVLQKCDTCGETEF